MVTPLSCPFPASCILSTLFSHFISSRFSSITPSNVMRNLSNVVSFSQSISSRDAPWPIPRTAKIGRFSLGSLSSSLYRSAQITIKVNVLFPCTTNQDRDTATVPRLPVMEVHRLRAGAARKHRKRVSHA